MLQNRCPKVPLPTCADGSSTAAIGGAWHQDATLTSSFAMNPICLARNPAWVHPKLFKALGPT